MMEFFDYNTFMMPAEDIYDLAIKYKKGDGVEKSNYIAADLFYKSAIKGFDLARIDLFRQTIAANLNNYRCAFCRKTKRFSLHIKFS